MARAAYMQTSMLGGEWSALAQGRMTDESYRTGLNVCRNSIPIEEGAWTRRGGTRLCANTRKGRAGKLLEFHFTQAAPYNVELTDGMIRFFAGPNLVIETADNIVLSISADEPAVIQTAADHGWVDGNAVQFYISAGDAHAGITPLLQRTFEINALTANTFSIVDQLTGVAVDGAALALDGTTMAVARVLEIASPYTDGDWAGVSLVQDEDEVLLLHEDFAPRRIVGGESTGVEGVFRTFTMTTGLFVDGPYLDPIDETSTLTPSGTTGSITLTEAGADVLFQTTDVGRLIRLFSSPANWSSATAYTLGQSVTYKNNFWTALRDNTNKKPDVSLDDWALDPAAAIWSWARITARASTTQVTATILGDDLLSTNAIRVWRMGLYSDTTGWPSVGEQMEGRLWLNGPIKNRFDASRANDEEILDFGPTEPDGTVADDNGMAGLAQGNPDVNTILWFKADDQGMLIGTQAGEWLVRASATNDPLTPTSVQVKQMTNYGSDAVQPMRVGMSVAFVNRHSRKLMEYTAYGEAKFGGTNLSRNAKHLTKSGIAEIAFVKELTPIIWARMVDGTLAGCTYRRDNPVGTQSATFSGWHRHDFGHDRTVTSISAGPSVDGTLDSLMMITKDDDDLHYVELLTDLFDIATPIYEAWHLDGAALPAGLEIVDISGTDHLRMLGYDRYEGEELYVWAAGIQMGPFTVTGGVIDVPFDDGGLLTTALLQSVSAEASTLATHANFATGTPGVIDAGGVLRYTRTDTNVTGLQGLSNAIIPDWSRNRLITSTEGAFTSGVDGFRRFNLTTGAEEEDVNVTAILSSGQEITAPYAIDSDGLLYWGASNPGYSQYACYDPSDFSAPVANFLGTANASYAAGRIATPTSLVVAENDTNRYLVASSSVHGEYVLGRGIYVMDWTDPEAAELIGNPGFDIYENGGGLARGPSGIINGLSYASAYFLGSRAGGVSVSIAINFTLYHVVILNGELGGGEIATLAPASFEAGWTHFTDVQFGLYDETDGGLICAVATGVASAYDSGDDYIASQVPVVLAGNGHEYVAIDDVGPGTPNGVKDPTDQPANAAFWQDLGIPAVDNTMYIAKINPNTGTVAWVVPVNDYPTGEDLRMSRVQEGTYAFYSNVSTAANTYPLYVIDTSDGSSSIISVKNISNLRQVQAFNDYQARVIFRGSTDTTLTGAPGEPAPVPPTPATFSEDICSLDGTVSTFAYATYLVPIFAGFPYVSQGQILRPILPQESGAQTGPALGMTRRTHMYSMVLYRSQNVKVGTSFDALYPVKLETPGRTSYALNELYSGTVQDTLKDDYSFDSMIGWEVSGPYPCTVLAVGGFVQTQDR